MRALSPAAILVPELSVATNTVASCYIISHINEYVNSNWHLAYNNTYIYIHITNLLQKLTKFKTILCHYYVSKQNLKCIAIINICTNCFNNKNVVDLYKEIYSECNKAFFCIRVCFFIRNQFTIFR